MLHVFIILYVDISVSNLISCCSPFPVWKTSRQLLRRMVRLAPWLLQSKSKQPSKSQIPSWWIIYRFLEIKCRTRASHGKSPKPRHKNRCMKHLCSKHAIIYIVCSTTKTPKSVVLGLECSKISNIFHWPKAFQPGQSWVRVLGVRTSKQPSNTADGRKSCTSWGW